MKVFLKIITKNLNCYEEKFIDFDYDDHGYGIMYE